MTQAFHITDLMSKTGVQFGTSGVRGLAADMTDLVCYVYTTAFLQYLEESGASRRGETVAVGGDLRPSTDRVMKAAGRAATDRGYQVEHCGRLSSPALACHGLTHHLATVMVTGSHIPEDRNGIKYNKKTGEILKQDESGIRRQVVEVPEGLFDPDGRFRTPVELPAPADRARQAYTKRFIDWLPADSLAGARIGVYEHSSVSRDTMVEVLGGLGAEVIRLGFSERFQPVDTEAIRPEDVEAARLWARQHGFDAIVSTDGDGDRPLIADETGAWLRGDVAGIICSAYLEADAVVVPVSCNSAVEKCGWFKKVYRTRIGSPYVIEGMNQALADGAQRVVGYEANGGFLTASDISNHGKILSALPTRDAIIVQLSVLLSARRKGCSVGALLRELPQRCTFSARLKDFPSGRSLEKLGELYSGDPKRDEAAVKTAFGGILGRPVRFDTTDGLRIILENGEVVHLRPSGNAPEFRCYTEAGTCGRAEELNRACLAVMETWR